MASDTSSRGGRPPAEAPKRRQVAFRVDADMSEAFDAAVAAAAAEAPRGVNFTASDYLRGLFLADVERRGLLKERQQRKPKAAAGARR